MCTVFSQSGLQQLYLFINTKAKDPLALLFKKLWSEASPRVSQQAQLTRSGSRTLLSLHRGTTEAQNAAWCLLGNHPALSMACAINEYKDLRSPSSTSQRLPWPRAVGLLRAAQEGELRQEAQELLEVWVWCPADCTFLYPSLQLSRHNCPTLSKWRRKHRNTWEICHSSPKTGHSRPCCKTSQPPGMFSYTGRDQ